MKLNYGYIIPKKRDFVSVIFCAALWISITLSYYVIKAKILYFMALSGIMKANIYDIGGRYAGSNMR